jgi:type I restriction enzyme S subunit
MLTHRAATILGHVPEEWGRELLSDVLAEQKGGDWGQDSGDLSIRVLRSTNFTDRGLLKFTDVATRGFAARKAEAMGLRADDLLLERSGGGPTQPVGRIGFVSRDLPGYWFSNFVQLLRPNRDKIDPEFLGWVLFELNRCGIVERLQHQTTQMRNLDFRDYLRIYLPKPPPQEQRTIARILRVANEAVSAAEDELTAALRLKTALMQQLFARGVAGRHARFKQTKIGEIPEAWELVPLGRLASVVSGIALNQDRVPRFNPYQYLTVVHVQREKIDLTDVRYLEVFPHELPDALLRADDLLVVEGHANASEIGRAALATAAVDGFAYQNHLFRVRLLDGAGIDKLFLLGVLNSERVRRHWAATCNTSSGLNTINRRGLRKLLIPRPSPREQEEVVALISAANDTLSAAEAELDAVARLKRSLLQNLLTGHIRVSY